MSLNDTPVGERKSIGFFGCRNVGKSSIVNKVTGQDLSVVSDIEGTTTDPVKKSMEILPLGPVIIIDTPGIDDEGNLGEKRVEKTKKILRNCDIAVLITSADRDLNIIEERLIDTFNERKIPYIIVKNKADLINEKEYNNLKKISNENDIIYTSVVKNTGIEELKNAIGNIINEKTNQTSYLSDLIKPKDIVVLVTPIDSGAPKGRMIMPQQLAIRDIIDSNGIAVVTKETELEETLKTLKNAPALVVTDSQVFEKVDKIVSQEIPLTSFSILMARYKGFLKVALEGVKKLDNLKEDSHILICEGCTHHRQCDDIGTIKLPNWIREYTKLNLNFEWSNGTGFPEDLDKYDLIVHCGGCMLNSNEMKYRMDKAIKEGVPFTNYGITIAKIKGILDRAIKPIIDNDYKI